MRLLFFIPLFTLLLGQQPNKYLQGIDSREKNMDVTDRKYGDHNGNRIFNRFYNFGGIGDAGGSLSGIYPFGSGHSYFYEFTPVIAASVIATRPRILENPRLVSNVISDAAIIAPTIITEEMALVTDIKGVCSEGVTLQTT